MPPTQSYPGVYIDEAANGGRTISGVSTAVAAFIGSARRGPINKAVRVLSFADFKRSFGGLDAGSELSYAVQQFFRNGGREAWVVRLPKNAGAARFIGDRSARLGIYALESVDLFNLLCLPGVTAPAILAAGDAYGKERRAFFIIDAPRAAKGPADMLAIASGLALPKSDQAAVYYPWINTADPLKRGKLRTSAPCGTIAGLYARTDRTRGVWKAPAGTEATLTGVQGVDHLLSDPENSTLNPLGVNCIRIFPGVGALAWGARTLRGADQTTAEYKYVPVRRLALYIEESLVRGSKWTVFEPNDEPLWAQIRLHLGAFLHGLFLQGAFQGRTPREAYFVKCDRQTTTQNDINNGVFNIMVGFAPLKPAEFVMIRIQQRAGQIAV